ncbi:MAG TPA: aminotransferase class V-fold PLP-dependent enzyme [Xanthobacteraceae bacterium]|nr:aminotransferase class V-fold PLP-dependent enzyme [Xanthobacteraceae bacterium]
MLPSQRALFDIPREICFLNAASWCPLPIAVQEAGRAGVARKGQPWTIDPAFASRQHERARRAAARLINADSDDVALMSSVSYGVATAAKVLAVPAGTRVLMLENDHSSAVLEWTTRAGAQGFTVDVVRQPDDGDWTAAVLAAIERRGAPPVGLASISSVHWSDGGVIDIDRVATTLRARGAALLVDATQAAGVIAIDVRGLDPDFLVFPTYKWLLGPYGRAFLYIAKRHQEGVPLEQTSYGRRDINSERAPYFRDVDYVSGGRRFDMGERDHFISMEMASMGIELVTEWGSAAIAARLAMLTGRLADALGAAGVTFPRTHLRAPHILSVSFPKGIPDKLIEGLAAQSIFVARRIGRMRVSPHVYNDEADIDRFIEAFRRLLA